MFDRLLHADATGASRKADTHAQWSIDGSAHVDVAQNVEMRKQHGFSGTVRRP